MLELVPKKRWKEKEDECCERLNHGGRKRVDNNDVPGDRNVVKRKRMTKKHADTDKMSDNKRR
jgi:hypothetical protein